MRGPWIAACGSVFRNPETGKLRMWYESIGFNNTLYVIRTCLAESFDGVNWKKTDLVCYSFNGSKSNNIVLAAPAFNRFNTEEEKEHGAQTWKLANVKYLGDGPPLDQFPTHYDGTNVVYDHKETDPDKRYKWIGWMEKPDDPDKSLNHNMLSSPDGIHWDMRPEKLMCKVNDGTKVQWDPIGNRWSLTYLKSTKLDIGENVRSYGMIESDDLRNWKVQDPPIVFDEEDDYGRKLHGHFLMPYPYGDQYVRLVSMIHTREGWAESFLVSSRDGRKYERNFRHDPFIRIGGEDEFDADCAEIAVGAPILIGDYLYFYYTGRSRRPWSASGLTGNIGLMTLKRDRFAGFTNGMWFNRKANNLISSSGVIVTKPVEVTGPSLYFNGRTRDTKEDWGIIQAELLDESMKPIPGYTMEECIPFKGDEIRNQAHWEHGNSVEKLMGQKVSVKFTLNLTTIYDYIFE